MISESDVERLPAALAARLALESNPESGHSSGHDASEESVQCMQGKDKGSRGSLVLDSGAPRSSKGRRESATGIVDILSRIGEMGHDEETGHDDHVINFSSAVSDSAFSSDQLSEGADTVPTLLSSSVPHTSLLTRVPSDGPAQFSFKVALVDCGPQDQDPAHVVDALLSSGTARVSCSQAEEGGHVHLCYAGSVLCEVRLHAIPADTSFLELQSYDGFIVLCNALDDGTTEKLDMAQVSIEKAKGEGFSSVLLMALEPDDDESCPERTEACVCELHRMSQLYCMAFARAVLANDASLAAVVEDSIMLCYWNATNVDIITPELALLSHREANDRLRKIKRKQSKNQAAKPLPPSMIKEGWLHKLARGSTVSGKKVWTQRYFTLERNVLSYCKDPESLSRPLGMVNLSTVQDIFLDYKADKSGRAIVCVQDMTQSLLLHADQASVTQEWLDALRMAKFGSSVQITPSSGNLPSKLIASSQSQGSAPSKGGTCTAPLLDAQGRVKVKYAAMLQHASLFRFQAAATPLDDVTVTHLLQGRLKSSVSIPSRRVMIFLMSGGEDFDLERSYLHSHAGPFLRLLCRQLGWDCSLVDPHHGFGAPELAMCTDFADAQATLARACVSTSAATCNLLFLGNRYDLCPLPPRIEEGEYRGIKAALLRGDSPTRDDDVTRLDTWYAKDDNTLTSCRVLRNPEDTFPLFSQHKKERQSAVRSWASEQQSLRDTLRKGAAKLQGEDASRRYVRSLTDQLCMTFVDQDEERSGNSLAFVRLFKKPNIEDKAAGTYLYSTGGTDDDVMRSEHWRRRVCDVLRKDRVISSTIPWVSGHGMHPKQHHDHLVSSVEAMVDVISSDILNAYRQHSEEDLVFEVEHHRQHFHALVCSTGFTRPALLDTLSAYIAGAWRESSPAPPLVLHGASGCGKSWLLAHALRDAQTSCPGLVSIFRGVGVTSASTQPHRLVRSICEQLLHVLGQPISSLAFNLDELGQQLQTCLASATGGRPILLVIDALELLESSQGCMQNLGWLHMDRMLPPNVRMVVSVSAWDRAPNVMTAVRQATPLSSQYVEVGHLHRDMLSVQAVNVLMKDIYKKSLTHDQARAIVWAFDACPLPLGLRLLLKIASGWASYTAYGEGPAMLQDEVACDLHALATIVIAGVEDSHGVGIVRRVLGAIAMSAGGMTSSEIHTLLYLDDAPKRRYPAPSRGHAHTEPCVLIWSRMEETLGEVLLRRWTGRDYVYAFRYSVLRQAVVQRYGLDMPPNRKEALQFLEAVHAYGLQATERDEAALNIKDSVTSSGRHGGVAGSSSSSSSSGGPTRRGLLARAGSSAPQQGAGSIAAVSARLGLPVSRGPRGGLCKAIGPCSEVTFEESHSAISMLQDAVANTRMTKVHDLLADLSFVTMSAKGCGGDELIASFHHAAQFLPPETLAEMYYFVSQSLPLTSQHASASLLQQALCSRAASDDIRAKARALAGGLGDAQAALLFEKVFADAVPVTSASASAAPSALGSGQGGSGAKLLPPKRGSGVWNGSPVLHKKIGSGTPILKAMFVADGSAVILVTTAKAVMVVSLQTGKVLASMSGHKGKLLDADQDAGSKVLVTAAADNTVRCWDIASGKLLKKAGLDASAGQVVQVCVCRDGDIAVVRFSNGQMSLWEMSSSGSLTSLVHHADLVTNVEFGHGGQTFASSSRDKTIALWSGRAKTVMRTLLGHEASVETCHFHPSGALLLTSSEDCTVRIWEVRTGNCLTTLRGHKTTPELCCFGPSFEVSQALSASRDGMVRLWCIMGEDSGSASSTSTPTSGGPKQKRDSGSDPMTSLYRDAATEAQELAFDCCTSQMITRCMYASHGHVVAASSDKALALWDARNGCRLQVLPGAWPVWTISPDGSTLLAISSEGETFMMSLSHLLASGRSRWLPIIERIHQSALLRPYQHLLPDGAIRAVAMYDSNELFAICDRGAVGRYSVVTGQQLQRWVCSSRHVNTLVVHAGSGRMACAGDDGSILVFDVASMAVVDRLQEHIEPVMQLAFRNDGRLLMSCSLDNTCKIWDMSSGLLRKSIEIDEHAGGVTCCMFAPDGDKFAVGGLSGFVGVYNTQSGTLVCSFQDHMGPVNDLSMPTVGGQLASVSTDRSVIVYDLIKHRVTCRFRGHTAPVVGCGFSPKHRSSWLITASIDSTIKIWDVASRSELTTISPTQAPLTALAKPSIVSELETLQMVACDAGGAVHTLLQCHRS